MNGRFDSAVELGMLKAVGKLVASIGVAATLGAVASIGYFHVKWQGLPDDPSEDTANGRSSDDLANQSESATDLLAEIQADLRGQYYRVAREKLETLEKRGNPEAKYQLALVYRNGLGGPSDEQKAIALLHEAALDGQKDAQWELGQNYEHAAGINKSATTAAEWYERAANQGHAAAQNAIGRRYFDGLGVERDRQRAAHWLEEAAQQDFAPAMNQLAEMYLRGEGVEVNPSRALQWYQKAAALGNTRASMNAGDLLLTGKGIPPNPKSAMPYLEAAAIGGESRAIMLLGYAYAEGLGVEPSTSRALVFFRRAAELGDAAAQYNLGVLYGNGGGVGGGMAIDSDKARRWFEKAQQSGSPDAAAALRQLGGGASQQPVRESSGRSSLCDPRYFVSDSLRGARALGDLGKILSPEDPLFGHCLRTKAWLFSFRLEEQCKILPTAEAVDARLRSTYAWLTQLGECP